MKQRNLSDVLGGNSSIKIDIAIDYVTIAYLALGVFLAVLLGVFVSNFIMKKI